MSNFEVTTGANALVTGLGNLSIETDAESPG